MTRKSTPRTALVHAAPWLVGVATAHLTAFTVGRLLARRLDSGDAGSTEMRRVKTHGQLEVTPTSQSLESLQFDLMFAGLQIDLTQAAPAPGGVDVTLDCVFAGAEIRVPRGWKVAWDTRGPGGVDVKRAGPSTAVEDPAAADLRVHLRALGGGVAVKV